MPQSKLTFFASHPLVAWHPHFLSATFFASHPLVAKFLGVRGYFFSLGILKFRHCE